MLCRMIDRQRPLLVLDLDETLMINVTRMSLDVLLNTKRDGKYIYKRPFLDEFLDTCFRHFDVGVWTAAGDGYCDMVCDAIFGGRELRFKYSDKQCTNRDMTLTVDGMSRVIYIRVKDMNRVWDDGVYPRARCIVIDDNPYSFMRNPEVGILIRSWDGSPDDRELAKLSDYLERMVRYPTFDWRWIDKSHWSS